MPGNKEEGTVLRLGVHLSHGMRSGCNLREARMLQGVLRRRSRPMSEAGKTSNLRMRSKGISRAAMRCTSSQLRGNVRAAA